MVCARSALHDDPSSINGLAHYARNLEMLLEISSCYFACAIKKIRFLLSFLIGCVLFALLPLGQNDQWFMFFSEAYMIFQIQLSYLRFVV